MTHLEQYEAMLKSAGIGYEVTPSETESGGQVVKVERGYNFFYTEHVFDSDGKLIDVGAWE